MRFVFAFGWIPVLVVKSKPPGEFRGFTRIFTALIFPFTWIHIHPDFWDDEHILVHELQHVEDYLRNPWMYYYRYQKPAGRLRFEIRAYARQFLSYDHGQRVSKIERYVSLIMNRYQFSYDVDDVRFKLRLEIDLIRARGLR